MKIPGLVQRALGKVAHLAPGGSSQERSLQLFGLGVSPQQAAASLRAMPLRHVHGALRPAVTVMQHPGLASSFGSRDQFVAHWTQLESAPHLARSAALQSRDELVRLLGDMRDTIGHWSAFTQEVRAVLAGEPVQADRFRSVIVEAIERGEQLTRSYITDFGAAPQINGAALGVSQLLLNRTHQFAEHLHRGAMNGVYTTHYQRIRHGGENIELQVRRDHRIYYAAMACGLYRIKGAQWLTPDFFEEYFPSQGGAVVPLLPLRVRGEELSDAALAQLGIERVMHGGVHLHLPLLVAHFNMAPGIHAARRVAHIPGGGQLPIVREGIGMRVLTTDEEIEAHEADGSLEAQRFIGMRLKGIGTRYYGHGHHTEARDRVRPRGEILDGSPDYGQLLVGKREWLGREGIFLDQGHQTHSQIPYGAAAFDDVAAIARDAALLRSGAVMSVINLDAVPLLNANQLPELSNNAIFITRGVLVDTSVILDVITKDARVYRRWVQSHYGTPFTEARAQHLHELCFNIGRNLYATLQNGYTVRPDSGDTSKDFSAIGGLKDTGELVHWSDYDMTHVPAIVASYLQDVDRLFAVAGVSQDSLLSGEHFAALIRGMIPGLGEEVDYVEGVRAKAQASLASGQRPDQVTAIGHALMFEWAAAMGVALRAETGESYSTYSDVMRALRVIARQNLSL